MLTATTGEQAFRLLRDYRHPIDWHCTRAVLPGLIDIWILAGHHHDNRPERPEVINACEARFSSGGDVERLYTKQSRDGDRSRFGCLSCLAGQMSIFALV